ncbi:hypothetical protein O6H91_06G056400 [Diphasiastrum complanatum]|uniref:Uncharacterized protein n=1 Tax=Diphasiastrum complanatum TaxID=34168 RepID=A0ACC2DDY4_DIPCM|nr:hypothetical protein O6H91_06G056400 [Diphasiastrum complanatum]
MFQNGRYSSDGEIMRNSDFLFPLQVYNINLFKLRSYIRGCFWISIGVYRRLENTKHRHVSLYIRSFWITIVCRQLLENTGKSLKNTAPVSAALPQEDEMDRLVSIVEAKVELATALGTILSAEPSSASFDVLLRLLRNIFEEPQLEKFRK